MAKNILNKILNSSKEYAKIYDNEMIKIKRQEKINMYEIEWLLDSLGVDNMVQFYQQYGIVPNKNDAIIFKVDYYDFFAYRYLNMVFVYPYQCLNEYTRSSKVKEIEFYEVLRGLYDNKDYETFDYLAKILEFTTSENIIDAFTPYLVAHRLSK